MGKIKKLDVLRESIGIIGAIIIGIFFTVLRNDMIFLIIILPGYIVARAIAWLAMNLKK